MFVLSDELIEENKNKYKSLLIEALSLREGADIDGLINKLDSSDWFYAPASTRYHNCIKGGLVDHSLNVYYNMLSLAKNKHLLAIHENKPVLDDNGNETGEFEDIIVEGCIEQSSIAIVALLHDFSKMNYYTTDYRNKKVYCDSGSKKDENGKFDWVSVKSYKTVDIEDRFIYGSHEETAEFMVRQFVPLSYQESCAILHHHCAMSFDSIKDVGVVANTYNRYPIAALLHIADFMSTYIDEAY